MNNKNEVSKTTFEKWVHQFGDELFNWAYYKTSSKETAEDLVQETFMAAYHKIESFEGKSQPKTWLFSILNHKIIDYYRANSKVTKISIYKTEAFGNEYFNGLFNENNAWKNMNVNPLWEKETSLLDDDDFNRVLKNCFSELPEKWNIALTSKYLTDKKTPEICQELNINVTNYWQIVHRAKVLLKNCIELKWSH